MMMRSDTFSPASVAYNGEGLVPVIVQRSNDGEVLMLAWMNQDALKKTLETGQMVYWSRSRKALWRKGESSGNTQALKEMRLDCDGDTLLAQVEQKGPACHTGAANCFFRRFFRKGIKTRRTLPTF